MGRTTKRRVAEVLLARHGTLWSADAGIPLGQGTPSPLFRWLCLSNLLSARISGKIAVAASRALADQGWSTPRKMHDATWEQRTRTLNESGYARYDEKTSTMLGQNAELLLERYDGDLRKLRDAGNRDPDELRERLKAFKGIGDVGVNIFFRETQIVWDELHPFADDRALKAAQALDLGSDASTLARLVDRDDFARLVAALVRVDLEKDYDGVREAADGKA